MAKKYTYMWAIIIKGNFMEGKIFYKTREEAFAHLESEVIIGYKKLKEVEEACSFNEVYYTLNKEDLRMIDGYVGEYLACADDYEKYITYSISRIRVRV